MADAQAQAADPETGSLAQALSVLEVEQMALMRHDMASSDAARRAGFYDRMHRYYAPIDGDQWPEDLIKRPNKFHVTANIVKSFVDIESRVLSIMPKIQNKPPVESQEMRQKSEVAERLFKRYLDDNDFDVLFADWNRSKSLYGRGALKVYWDDTIKPGRPAVLHVERPENLVIGWGASDFSVMDWAMYEYKISPLEAHLAYPSLEILPPKGRKDTELLVIRRSSDHSDPLDQKSAQGNLELNTRSSGMRRFLESEYEKKQVTVWDYWYKTPDGVVCNAILVQGTLVGDVVKHPELPVLPYIVAENDHEPGSPEGISTAEVLIDLQMVLNRVLSLWTQVVADDTEPAWQLLGDDTDMVPAGLVPMAGHIVAPGAGAKIEKIDKNINQYPAQLLIDEVWKTAHRITGISEIMFGNASASVDSARVLATQIEAAQNRLDPKRRRAYAAVRQMLQMWGYMLQNKNPEISVSIVPPPSAPGETPEAGAQSIKLGEFLSDVNQWVIIPPEITPRDSVENTNNVINKVTANMMPRIEGMDEIGMDSPEQSMAIMLKELANPRLNPQAVQAFTAVLATLQSIEAQAQAQQGAQNPQAAAQAGAGSADQLAAQQQSQAPTGLEDQNNPATGIGSAPPPGAGVPGGGFGGTLQPVVRQTAGGKSESLSQILLPERKV